MSTIIDVVVIGAGQAGLATAYHLAEAGLNFILLDRHARVGDSWRERYDSLILFTPKLYSELPGFHFPGDPSDLPDKEESAGYLEAYAEYFQFPIHLNTSVTQVSKRDGYFNIETNQRSYQSRNIVIATGPFQRAWMPSYSSNLSEHVLQLHSSSYRNPKQLLSGETLVVGAGNSGAQIAVELSEHVPVSLSVGHPPFFLPVHFFGKSIFYWFDKLGLLHATKDSLIGRKIKSKPDPIFGLELKRKMKDASITLLPNVTGAEKKGVQFADGRQRMFNNIIWCTGFRANYEWLHFPHVKNENGSIIHERGITPESGLYVVGMPWQYRRTSALLGGVGHDARYVVEWIIRCSR